MYRRDLLRLLSTALPASGLGFARREAFAAAPAAVPEPVHRLAAGWRGPADGGEGGDRVGILEIDWAARSVRIAADLPAPGRVHGLQALADGGFVAVATRPGTWLMRCDAQGRIAARITRNQELPSRSFNGHVHLSHDAKWLFTTEAGPAGATAWVSVRDAQRLQRVQQFPSAGFDAHQCLLDDDGNVFIANGGLLRAEDGRKIEAERMSPSLAHIDPDSGEVLGQWRLPDARLSLRHLAWALPETRAGDAKPLIGIGLQAEHDDAARRREAPALALFDGKALSVPTRDAQAYGYVGDIAAGPSGGFVLSGQKAARGLWWRPQAPAALATIAELTELCALTTLPDTAGGGVLIGSARGIAWWHPARPARMLPWPKPMLPDNHWEMLPAA
jgi:uncharacterized protein